jgi:5-deoxy-glucuronate isomerase
MPAFPADRLLVCEVFTPGGNWSGWPPHKHDVDAMPHEAILEETYYYHISRPEGWGVARIFLPRRPGRYLGRPHRRPAAGDAGVTTPSRPNPSYDAYYINFLAGDRRTMANSDDPGIAWVRDMWPVTERDPRVPLGGRDRCSS